MPKVKVYEVIVTVEELKNKNIVARAVAIDDPSIICGTGISSCHPDDKYNSNVGTDIAISRALESLTKKIAKRGHGLVKHIDDMKEKNLSTKSSKTKDISLKFRKLSPKKIENKSDKELTG